MLVISVPHSLNHQDAFNLFADYRGNGLSGFTKCLAFLDQLSGEWVPRKGIYPWTCIQTRMCKCTQTTAARSMNHCVLTRERLAMLHKLSDVYKTPNKKVLDEDFRSRGILNYEKVPPLCMKVCLFFILLTRVFQRAI